MLSFLGSQMQSSAYSGLRVQRSVMTLRSHGTSADQLPMTAANTSNPRPVSISDVLDIHEKNNGPSDRRNRKVHFTRLLRSICLIRSFLRLSPFPADNMIDSEGKGSKYRKIKSKGKRIGIPKRRKMLCPPLIWKA